MISPDELSRLMAQYYSTLDRAPTTFHEMVKFHEWLVKEGHLTQGGGSCVVDRPRARVSNSGGAWDGGLGLAAGENRWGRRSGIGQRAASAPPGRRWRWFGPRRRRQAVNAGRVLRLPWRALAATPEGPGQAVTTSSCHRCLRSVPPEPARSRTPDAPPSRHRHARESAARRRPGRRRGPKKS